MKRKLSKIHNGRMLDNKERLINNTMIHINTTITINNIHNLIKDMHRVMFRAKGLHNNNNHLLHHLHFLVIRHSWQLKVRIGRGSLYTFTSSHFGFIDNEAFANMIMAWYYSGYYTGYYQVSTIGNTFYSLMARGSCYLIGSAWIELMGAATHFCHYYRCCGIPLLRSKLAMSLNRLHLSN